MEEYKNKEKINEAPLACKAGSFLKIRKRDSLQRSRVEAGMTLSGILQHDIALNTPIYFEDSNTSPVKRVYRENNVICLETATSTYEVLNIRESDRLEFKNDLGEVCFPENTALAEFDTEIVDHPFGKNADGNLVDLYINKPALQGTLFNTHGYELLRAMNGRFIVLAKVKNIHVPFYISSKGTSGKRQGEWYPFFGHIAGWVVKGTDINEDGSMIYHHEITKVQNRLNENLIIPINYVSPQGKIGTENSGSEPTNILFDLNDHLKYDGSHARAYDDDDVLDVRYIRKMTGYNPKNVTRFGKDSTANSWINDVIMRIE